MQTDVCRNNTVWDVISQDQDLSIIAVGTRNNNADIFLNSPNVNATVFAPTNIASVRGLYEYAGITDIDTEFFGSGLTILLLAYGVAQGRLSPQNLTSVPSINSLMGMLNNSDYTLNITENTKTGKYYVTGLAPDNTAKVLNVTKACNGYVYKIDKVLQPSYLARVLPTRFGFGTQIVDILYKGNCPVPLEEAVQEKIPQSQEWVAIWNATGMINPLSDSTLGTTIFVPQNNGVVDAGNAATTADAVMYNMLRGNWCPEELIAAGTKNSMLGEVQGKDLPLTFSKDADTGDFLISGPLGAARVVDVSIACSAVIYTTNVPLLPPTPPADAVSAAPRTLPGATARHITCTAPLYGLIAVDAPDPSKNPAIALEEAARQAANAVAIDKADTDSEISSSSSNTALAIGLGVGISCAVLLGGAAGFLLAKRHRQQNTNNNTKSELLTSTSSDLGTSAKLLPGQSMVGTSVLSSTKFSLNITPSSQYQTSGDGMGATATFASILDIFCDSAGVADNGVKTTTAKVNTAAIPSATGSTTGATCLDSNSNRIQLARLVSSSDKNSVGVDLWDVNHSDLQIAVDSSGYPIELGKGSYGTVYRGTIRQVQPAAIKVLNENLGIEASAAFWREAAILKHASRDRNVVQLYGTSTLPNGKFLLITELMEQGDLRNALTNRKTAGELLWSRKGKSIAIDISRGITALHAINVIHRDLKSKNVLLTDNLTAKVADVGIAGVHSQGYLTAGAGQVVGTLAWSAPELLLGERCSDKVDIYSLGVVLWELATGNVPQRGFVEPPPPSRNCPAELSLLIKDCINLEPSARPNAKQVYQRLLQIPQ
ncbi:hypothetical protein Ndes2437A_g07613 [Nannochloris sp. 'desiccata']